MTSLKVLVVEDEILIAETIKMYLEERGHEAVNMAISYEEAVEAYQKAKPDVILLDIRLYGEKSGVDFAHALQNDLDAPPIVYLTSQYDKKSLENALATKPSGYLGKPIQKFSLWTTIELAYQNHHTQIKNHGKTVKIPDGNTSYFVDENDILYIQAVHVYVKIYRKNSEAILSRFALSEIIELLSKEIFLQCHRSYIINRNHVAGWNSDSLIINDELIPMSRSRKKEVLDFLDSK